MKHALVGVALTAAAVLVTAAGASPSGDAVQGAGTVTFADWPPGESTTEQVVVQATAGAQGEDARGTIVQHSPLGDIRADVTCLDVDGGSAVVGGTIVSGTYYPGTTSYQRIAFWIKDGGPGGAPDGWTGLIFGRPFADPCARLLELAGQFELEPLPLELGAFNVTDAS